MSRNHIPQARAHNAPVRFPAYYSPTYDQGQGFDHNTDFELGQRAVPDLTLRSSARMPNFSTLTNSALVDALLTTSVNDRRENQREQNVSIAPSTKADVGNLSKKRSSHPTIDLTDELYYPDPDDAVSTVEHDVEQAPRKKPRKQQKRKPAASAELDDDYIEEDDDCGNVENSRTKRKPRRSIRAKKSPVPTPRSSTQDEIEQQQVNPAAEIEHAKKPITDKKTKKSRGNRLIRKKPIGMAVPKTLSEATDADRMMWQWKNAGRNWEEIRTEWKRLTGVEPGGSSLSVRYIKLNENLARNGAAGDIELLRFKKEAEEELMSQLWPRVAEKMLAFSPESEHNPKDLQKRYKMIVRANFDVENLKDEDDVKLEAEQTSQPPFGAGPNAMDRRDCHAQSSAVCGNAANVLNGHESDQSHGADIHQEKHRDLLPEHARMVEENSNIFENLGLLQHQVDGLIDSQRAYCVDFQMQHHNEVDPFIFDEALTSYNPGNERMRESTMQRRLPSGGSLVTYGSDSE